jgi:hypothetical protein
MTAEPGTPSASSTLLDAFVVATSRRDIEALADRWRVEIEAFCPEERDFDVAECAELADELDLYRVMAEDDDDFVDEYGEWDGFVWEHELWLPLEQCCDDGVLLPMEERALRLRTCPEELLRGLRWFFELCPAHVKHHLALHLSLLVRSERARRLGTPRWRAETAASREEPTVFFRPPVLVVRKQT